MTTSRRQGTFQCHQYSGLVGASCSDSGKEWSGHADRSFNGRHRFADHVLRQSLQRVPPDPRGAGLSRPGCGDRPGWSHIRSANCHLRDDLMFETTRKRRSRGLELKEIPGIRMDTIDGLPALSAKSGHVRHGSCPARRSWPTGSRVSNRAVVGGSDRHKSLLDSARCGAAERPIAERKATHHPGSRDTSGKLVRPSVLPDSTYLWLEGGRRTGRSPSVRMGVSV